MNDLKGLLNEGNLTQSKSFIRSFVKEVSVKGGEVVLRYTIPLFKNEGLKEGFEGASGRGVEKGAEEILRVPPIVRNGGRYWI